jgi:hypothetical protein
MALGIVAAASAPASSSTEHTYQLPATAHQTVAYNWWKGSHEPRHFYGSVRPRVLGASFGEPVQNIHWRYWGKNTAMGKGLLIHMSCQPCRVTIYLHDVRTSHGTHYFEKLREHFTELGSTGYEHWSGRDWVG